MEALRAVDVNLFVAFDALARERNVTRAAERMGVTQSAMSHTLRRLRALFDDPLLVRGEGGMVLTPRAEALVVPLRAGLVSLSRALHAPGAFDAAHARRAFRIASPDLFDVLVLPGLLRRFAQVAPGVDLAVVPMPSTPGAALETGELDLVVQPHLVDGSHDYDFAAVGGLQRRTLFRDRLRCFVREGHPAIPRRGGLSMKRYVALGHVLVSPRGEGAGLVDRALAERDATRRVTVRVPQFSTALAILEQSDLVLTAPSALARVAGRAVSLAPPVALPEHAVAMLWHPRFTEDPAHRWLREQLVAVTRDVRP